jgi:hypothetical protein
MSPDVQLSPIVWLFLPPNSGQPANNPHEGTKQQVKPKQDLEEEEAENKKKKQKDLKLPSSSFISLTTLFLSSLCPRL